MYPRDERDGDDRGHRYANVVFRPRAVLAYVRAARKGTLPSGARKVGLVIEGAEETVEARNPDVSKNGYLTTTTKDASKEVTVPTDNDAHDLAKIKIVVVVGLLHANGVINLLASRGASGKGDNDDNAEEEEEE